MQIITPFNVLLRDIRARTRMCVLASAQTSRHSGVREKRSVGGWEREIKGVNERRRQRGLEGEREGKSTQALTLQDCFLCDHFASQTAWHTSPGMREVEVRFHHWLPVSGVRLAESW